MFLSDKSETSKNNGKSVSMKSQYGTFSDVEKKIK